MKTIFRWLIKFILLFFIIAVVGTIIISYFDIPIDLTHIKKPVEELIGSTLDREVKIEKSIIVTTSLAPAFSIEGLRIYNPAAFSTKTFMHLDKALIRIELFPLISKKLHIAEIEVKGLELNLERTSDEKVNWAFTPVDQQHKSSETPPEKDKKKIKSAEEQLKNVQEDSIVVKKLHLNNLTVHYYSPDAKAPYTYHLIECNGQMSPGEPLRVQFAGDVDKHPYHLTITLASLKEFLSQHQTWVKTTAEIADTNLSFSGNVNFEKAHRVLTLETVLNGKNLSSLNTLIGVDLPPFSSYKLKTVLSLRPNVFELHNLSIATADSVLEGSATIKREKENYFAKVDMISEHIQLDDFTFENWSWKQDVEKNDEPEVTYSIKEKPESLPKKDSDEILKLTDPNFLSKFDLALQIESREVLSGKDRLGSGNLNLTLKDGKLSINPLEINIPGGAFSLMAFVQPGIKDTAASLQMRVKNFDIGILARRAKPDSIMSGLVNLDTNLSSKASSLSEILANGNGYFDFSGQLKNINAGLIDLWAVNLISAIVVGTGEKESQINCAVCRWTVKDGILTPDTFFIDTSKIRICVKGKVDLKRNYVDLTVGPTPKRPEFFNLAAPLKVQGTFSDINFALKKGDLVGHVIAFITSPVHVPIRRIFGSEIPQDGSDACDIALGAENREIISVKGCR